jgi:UDP-glucose 4-epimerase
LNLFYPEPFTVLEISEMVRDVVREVSGGALEPRIEVVDQGLPSLFGPEDKYRFRVDVSRTLGFLGLERLIGPRASIEYIVRRRLGKETG